MGRKLNTMIILAAAVAMNAGAATFGNWKNYPVYAEITDIEPAGKMVYVLSSGALFSYNNSDGSVTTYDKVYPLSDCNISMIAWNGSVKRLIAVYENGNIDLLDNNGNATNIADYYSKTMTVDKTVNNVVINGKTAYLCTAFGMVQVDMERALLMDTYNIGKNVGNCTVKGTDIYAQTDKGVYKGNMKENLINPANWKKTDESVDFSHPNDISQDTGEGYTRRYTYDKTNKCYWTSQSDNKLQAYTIADDGSRTILKQDIAPDAPVYQMFGFMTVSNGKLYTCNGGEWSQDKTASIQVYDPGEKSWTVYENEGVGEKYGLKYRDILCLAVDPTDDSHVWAGAQTGLYEFRNGKVVNHFGHNNSPITGIAGISNPDNYQLVTSLAYDSGNNLWVSNSGAAGKTMLVYTAESKWAAPEKQFPAAQAVNSKIMIDRSGRIWIASGRYTPADNGVFCYSADRTQTYSYTNFTNEDGTKIGTMEFLRQVVEDKEGNIWVATSAGLLVLTDEYQRDPSLGFYQIKVPRNDGTNFADYLLGSADITSIAVDNANRKWIGTKGDGLYVISSDNMVQEAHFKADDSCLLSDAVEYVTIDHNSGTVYIATANGLCSVESNATQTFDTIEKDNVWAYPNPVKPDYTGVITVVGLSFNADVKITTTSGTLVAQGRSTGGSFQWDGRDLKGKRVASGIYMVNAATESGESGTVCKIAIIN